MLGYILAAAVGLSLGILGGGGSTLTVPIFVYVMHFEPKVAIAMSLPVVGATSLVGALGHWRAGNFNLRVALAFGALAMTGAYLSARLSSRISGVIQLMLLAVVMIVAATLMLRRRPSTTPHDPSTQSTSARRIALVGAVGLGVGVLSGLVGVGGGFLFVPALVLLARLPMKVAIGTSLFVIAMNTTAASLGYHSQVDVPWRVVATFTLIAIIGIFGGTRLVPHIPTATLRRAFACFLFVIAGFILYSNRGVITRAPVDRVAGAVAQ